jgi:Tol biopolymer transport system component
MVVSSMTPERWEKIGDIYDAASSLSVDARAAYLEEACAGDESLRHEVESLLLAAERPGDVIDRPVLDVAAALFSEEEAPSLVGQTIGPYRVLSHLGSGGIGEVYLARDTRLDRAVALKTLSPSFATDPHWLQRLKTEALAVATLNHPNIATIYSVEEIDGCHFITMEYIEGRLLSGLIPADGLTLERFFTWLRPLVDAVAHAHEKGITHRDIKPSNIMITSDETPKLLDFGLARIDRETERTPVDSTLIALTRAGQILGTPSYMSPEQARGEQVDQRADIFSFGVVMYEALTGQRPFRGESHAAIISEVLKGEPLSVNEIKPGASALLARIILKCLSKERRARFQSMREVGALLDEARMSADATARPLFSGVWAKARRRLTGGFALALLSILFIAAAIFIGWGLLRGPAETTRIRFAITPTEPHADLSVAKISPDGKLLAYTALVGEQPQIYLRPLSSFDAFPLAGTEGALRPFFSSDSQWIGFFAADNKLKKISLAGGTALTICDQCPLGLDADWGANGMILVAPAETGIYRISNEGGQPVPVTKLETSRGDLAHFGPQIVEDGRSALFCRRTTRGVHLMLVRLATGELEDLIDLGDSSGARYLPSGLLVFGRSNQLFALSFDLGSRRAQGEAVPVLDNVHSFPNFQIARNGTLVYLPNSSMKDNALVLVDRQGGATSLLEKHGDYRSPRVAPDGRRVAVEVDRDIWIFEIGSERGLRLTFEGENRSPVWSRDGRRIMYASSRGGVWTIYEQDTRDGSEAERLHASEYRVIPEDLHPSGDSLLISQIAAGANTDLFTFGLGESHFAPFVASPFIESTPRFSPDGRWVAYFSDESGRPEIVLQSYPGPGQHVTVSRGGGTNPVWSKDGRELFYRWQSRLYSVEIRTDGELRVGAPRVLFEGRFLTSYDLAPDGQRFVMVRNEQGPTPRQLHVAVNWSADLPR